MGKIFDEVFKFTNMCYVPLNFYLNNEKIETNSSINNFDYFEKDNSLELSIFCLPKKERYETRTFYKNQLADNTLSILFLEFNLNIHKNKASEVLTLNRNKIQSEYYNTLIPDFFRSSFSIITQNFDKIFKNEEQKAIGSMYLHYYSNTHEFLKEVDISKFNQWEKLKISIDNEEKEILQLLNKIEKLTLIDRQMPNKDEYTLDNEHLSIITHLGYPAFHYTKFFLKKIQEKLFVNNIEYKEKGREITFSKESNVLINNDDYQKIIKSSHWYHSRQMIPCLDKYSKLRLKDSAHKGYVSHYDIGIPYPKMLSPFVYIEEDNNKKELKIKLTEDLYKWVYENRYDEKVKLNEIKSEYKRFVEEFDNISTNQE